MKQKQILDHPATIKQIPQDIHYIKYCDCGAKLPPATLEEREAHHSEWCTYCDPKQGGCGALYTG